MRKRNINDYGTGISQQNKEALARSLLPQIEKFFESEEGKREFEEWKKKQSSKDNEKVTKTQNEKNGAGQIRWLTPFFYLELYCYPKDLFTHKEVRVTMISCS